jgi:hypothetical protein
MTCSSSAITSGWAVITRALVVSSAEMASWPPPMLAPPVAVAAAPPFLSAAMLELTLEDVHQILGLAIFQVEDPGVALALQIPVELAHHLDDAGTGLGLAADDHGVGALVGHHLGESSSEALAP